ncbi:SGF29 tudor-like domain protein [Kalmanozyma brasiliensis GHG001]|uniref:SGF29 C-terminal domain-containing protein n=1 Tax=Kalmanozyma brasiliensis (strain GHG001) TaxID=1365824 RepID=V5GVC5_KALBG|nr:SGF29 tudor-like domain protein [Kalmanozyma brasiliensis GHG001]EST09852.1 SGF29 tudor-like domain protein [Kalmanozyma brasiliensis GHG001]
MALRRGKDRVSATGSEELQLWYAVRQNLRTLEKIRIASVDKASTFETLRVDVSALLEKGDRSDEYRTKRRKLDDVCHDLTSRTKDELAAIDSAQEKLGILVALRSSADGGGGSRSSTPRKELGSKGKAPTPAGRRGPPGPSSLGSGAGATGANRGRRETLTAQHPLSHGRRVAVLPSKTEEADWLKASVLSFAKSTNEYTVQDDDEPGPEGTYKVGMENIIPLPISLQTMPASDYSAGSRVLGMYPDTSCFYGATVKSGGPGLTRNANLAKLIKKEAELLEAKYLLEFDDDNGEIRQVPAWLVVQGPGM